MPSRKRNAYVDADLWEAFNRAIPPSVTKAQAWSAALYGYLASDQLHRFRLLSMFAEWSKTPVKERAAILSRHAAELGRLAQGQPPGRTQLGVFVKSQDPEWVQAASLKKIAEALERLVWQGEKEGAQPPQTEIADSRKTPDQR